MHEGSPLHSKECNYFAHSYSPKNASLSAVAMRISNRSPYHTSQFIAVAA
jgi:hypothetical protein